MLAPNEQCGTLTVVAYFPPVTSSFVRVDPPCTAALGEPDGQLVFIHYAAGTTAGLGSVEALLNGSDLLDSRGTVSFTVIDPGADTTVDVHVCDRTALDAPIMLPNPCAPDAG